MLLVRYRVQVLSDTLEGTELQGALEERWVEGDGPPAPGGLADEGGSAEGALVGVSLSEKVQR